MTATRGPKQNRVDTATIFQAVADQTYLPVDTIKLVVDTFVAVVKEVLLNKEKAVIRNFGVFLAKTIPTGVAVRFRAAAEFKKPIQELYRPMEKYGVEMKNEAVLLAQVTGECPDCKAKLESTNPPKCPNCGTAPFENKETK